MTCSAPTTKGELMLADRRHGYPLTITDFTTRFLITCDVLSTTREMDAFTVFERTFGSRTAAACYKRRKVNLSQVFAGQDVGVKHVDDHLWLVTFMDYDLGYFHDETCRLEPIDNPFGPKLLPMSPE